MTTKSALLTSLGFILAALAVTALFWSRLPEHVPTHWNLQGEVDGTMSPGGFVGFFLGMAGLLTVVLFALPKISPKGFDMEEWRPVYNLIIVVVIGMFSAVHVAIAVGAIGTKFDLTRVVIAVILAGLGVMGNLLGKVKRNFWVGVRTPWTLASEQVWTATHRLAARLTFGVGLIGAVAILVGVPPMAVFTAVMAVILYPVVYSYLAYRRIHS
jgi:uncharacterized membrane protein